MKSCEMPISNVLAGLQPATRRLVERALATPAAWPERLSAGLHTERELSRLLDSLDKQLVACKGTTRHDLQHLAETCVTMLQAQVTSAEVFAQLAARAHTRHDFARLDALGEILTQRFAPSEICEVARHPHPIIRALACETLVHLPMQQLAQLLADEVDAPVARFALEQKALAYDSAEALRLLQWWDDETGEFDEKI